MLSKLITEPIYVNIYLNKFGEMPGPVGRWLETFMCKQYADIFEAYGFKTLHSVCQLQPAAVQQMGIPPEHCDKILENVSVLRQSLVGPVVSNFSEQNYDHQLASHGQGNNSYSFQSPSSYQSPHSYGNPNGQMPYPTGEGYPVTQPRYRTSNQDIYGQPVYNNHLHPNQGSWDEPLRVYNHSPRHVMGNSPPPHSPMMRSPPPLSPSTAISIPSHYPHHVILDQSSVAHHNTWSSSQVISPSMVNSPRGTPSPGMGHPSNLSSPTMNSCSPAHAKPFSPPPYSPHPPPAHQQTVGYDYPPSQSSSPLNTMPNRRLSSPGSHHSPSDPLQSLQKMVLLDSQQSMDVIRSSSPAKCKPKLCSSEPLTEHTTTLSLRSNMLEKSKLVLSSTHEASSVESYSSMSLTPPLTGPPSSMATPTSDSENAVFNQMPANSHCTPAVDLALSEDSLTSDGISPGLVSDGHKPEDAERHSCVNNPEMPIKTDMNDETKRAKCAEVCREGKVKLRIIKENGHDALRDFHTVSRTSLLRPIKAVHGDPLLTKDISQSFSEPNQKILLGSEMVHAVRIDSSMDGKLSSSKNVRKKMKNAWGNPVPANKSKNQLRNHDGSKINGDKVGNWNLESSPDVTRVARRMKGREAVTGNFEIVNNCNQSQETVAQIQRSSATDCGEKEHNFIKGLSEMQNSSPGLLRRSGRLRSLSEDGCACNSISKLENTSSSQSDQHLKDLETKSDFASGRLGEPLNSKTPFTEDDNHHLKNLARADTSVLKFHCDTPCDGNGIICSSPGNGTSCPRKRGRPLGSKNRPRDSASDESETKKDKKKELKDYGADCMTNGRKQKTLSTTFDNSVIRKSGTEGKIKGPFLHFESTRDRLVNVLVVNTPVRDEEGEAKGGKKRGITGCEGTHVRNKMLMVGFNSTLSASYDVFTKDMTWVCSLCHKGSHYKGLGDLFGPYFEENLVQNPDCQKKGELVGSALKKNLSSLCAERKVREKRKRSELVEEFFKLTMAKKGKRVQDSSRMQNPEVHVIPAVPQISTSKGSFPKTESISSTSTKEIWVHEDCIIWCHGVYLLGQGIVGINSAVAASAAAVCSKCMDGGATLGCLQKGCKEHYHYLCAIETGCLLDEEKFSLFCFRHKKGRV